jgi:trigger factor
MEWIGRGMNLSVRETGTWQRTLDIEVPAADVERHLDDVARDIQRRASLPGFRKGRVPLDMVRQQFAQTVEQQFLESFVPKLTSEGVSEAGLAPVVPPLVRNLKFGPGQPLRFEAQVEVRPEIEAKDYRKLPGVRRVRTITDADFDRVMDELREESAVFADLDRPAGREDVVLLDSQRIDLNGRRMPGTRLKSRRIQLGAPEMLPELENALLGAEPGQERTFEMNYPDDYQNQELAGQRIRYVVKIRKIQEKKLRDLDDNFAREVFHLESLEELRSRVRANLESEEQTRIRREVEGSVSDALIQRNPVDLPERLVEWTLDRVMHEATGHREVPEHLKKDLAERYRPGVERSLKREVLLAAVARQEKLEVSDEEVASEIDRMARAEPRQAARIRARYQSAEARQGLLEALLERKALDWLIEQAELKDEEIQPSQLVVPAGR